MKRVLSARLIVVLSFFLFSACQTLDNRGDPGWANLTLEDSGAGVLGQNWSVVARIRAVQEAKVNLYVKLEGKVLDLKMGSGLSVLDFVQDDEELRKRVSAFVKGAKIIRTQNSVSGVEVFASLYLGENFRATLGLKEKKNTTTQGSSRDPSRSH